MVSFGIVEANENDFKKVEEDLLDVAKGVVRRCRMDLEASFMKDRLETPIQDHSDRMSSERIRNLKNDLRRTKGACERKRQESLSQIDLLTEELRQANVELAVFKEKDGHERNGRLHAEVMKSNGIIKSLTNEIASLRKRLLAEEQVATEFTRKYEECQKQLSETLSERGKFQTSFEEARGKVAEKSKSGDSYLHDGNDHNAMTLQNMEDMVKLQAQKLRLFARTLKKCSRQKAGSVGIELFEFTVEVISGLWNYEYFVLNDEDKDTLLDPLFITEGVVELMITECLLREKQSERGLNRRRFYYYRPNFFYAIDMAESNIKIYDTKYVITIFSIHACGFLEMDEFNNDVDENKRELFLARRPADWPKDLKWDVNAQLQDFEERFQRCVDYAVRKDMEDDRHSGRTNSMFYHSGIFIPICAWLVSNV